MQINGSTMLGAFLHHGRHRSGRTARNNHRKHAFICKWSLLPMDSRYEGKNNRYGVIRCEYRGKKRSIDVHRVMYCIANQVTLEDIAGMDASHLCHNSLCVTASHTVVEPQGINNNRIGCKSRLDGCSGHTPFPDCIVSLALPIEK